MMNPFLKIVVMCSFLCVSSLAWANSEGVVYKEYENANCRTNSEMTAIRSWSEQYVDFDQCRFLRMISISRSAFGAVNGAPAANTTLEDRGIVEFREDDDQAHGRCSYHVRKGTAITPSLKLYLESNRSSTPPAFFDQKFWQQLVKDLESIVHIECVMS